MAWDQWGMSTSNPQTLEARIEQLVREHLAAQQVAVKAAVERAFAAVAPARQVTVRRRGAYTRPASARASGGLPVGQVRGGYQPTPPTGKESSNRMEFPSGQLRILRCDAILSTPPDHAPLASRAGPVKRSRGFFARAARGRRSRFEEGFARRTNHVGHLVGEGRVIRPYCAVLE